MPNSPINTEGMGKRHRGSPKEGELTMRGAKEGFLEEVVMELGTNKTEPRVWAGLQGGMTAQRQQVPCCSFRGQQRGGAVPGPKSLLASTSLCVNGNHAQSFGNCLGPGPWIPPLAEGQEGSKVRGAGQGGGSVREAGSWLKPPCHI